ncbi:MAG: hypothetical protein KQ78_00590 [Candidatus Izimaplasma bacterium HR2]|nr:MAG: hypothetical protein KQ78_00590 [Candidatus Izimaplasma bacterium HR2]
MNSLKNLINELENDELIVRFKKIENIIDQDNAINKNFKNLLELQKKMVNDREKNPRNFENSSKLYEIAKSALTSNIIISEYIELLEDINYDLQMIQNIIGTEISADFE